MRDFPSKRGDASVSDVFARPGSRYLVIDIGGKEYFSPEKYKNAVAIAIRANVPGILVESKWHNSFQKCWL